MSDEEQEIIAPDRDGVELPEDDPNDITEAQERESVDLPDQNSIDLDEDKDGDGTNKPN